MNSRTVYLAAAEAFARMVDAVPADAWEAPALGVWDVRALVGHTSRALTTVIEYVQRPADTIACPTAEDYFAAAVGLATEQVHADVAERGVTAGRALGADPVATVRQYVTAAGEAITGPEDPIITTIAGGMRLSAYLQTRVFELTIHGLDLADALGIGWRFPDEAVEQTLVILARTGALTGQAPAVIRLLTGRGGSTFSVLDQRDHAR